MAMPDMGLPNRIDRPSIDLISVTFVDQVRPGVLTKMINCMNHNQLALADRVPQENLNRGFQEPVCAKRDCWPSKLYGESILARYRLIAGKHLAQRALDSGTGRNSNQAGSGNINLLTARGAVKFEGGSTAKSLPNSRKLHWMDCSWDRPDGTPTKGCCQEPPTIRLSAQPIVPLQRCMDLGLTVTDLISKANKPGWRNGIARPSERQTYEKGNVNQLIAAGRMPDCDC